jgi:hypothetical protein
MLCAQLFRTIFQNPTAGSYRGVVGFVNAHVSWQFLGHGSYVSTFNRLSRNKAWFGHNILSVFGFSNVLVSWLLASEFEPCL